MAYIEVALRTYILLDTTVTGLISTRFYYIKAPQDVVKPYAVYKVISDPDNRPYVGKDGSQPRVQIDVVADNPTDAKAVDEAIRSRISEYTGTLSGLAVIRIQPMGRRDFSEVDDFVEIQRDYLVEYIR